MLCGRRGNSKASFEEIAGRDQYFVGANRFIEADKLDLVRPLKNGARREASDTGAFNCACVSGFEPRSFLILVLNQRVPIEFPVAIAPPVAYGIFIV